MFQDERVPRAERFACYKAYHDLSANSKFLFCLRLNLGTPKAICAATVTAFFIHTLMCLVSAGFTVRERLYSVFIMQCCQIFTSLVVIGVSGFLMIKVYRLAMQIWLLCVIFCGLLQPLISASGYGLIVAALNWPGQHQIGSDFLGFTGYEVLGLILSFASQIICWMFAVYAWRAIYFYFSAMEAVMPGTKQVSQPFFIDGDTEPESSEAEEKRAFIPFAKKSLRKEFSESTDWRETSEFSRKNIAADSLTEVQEIPLEVSPARSETNKDREQNIRALPSYKVDNRADINAAVRDWLQATTPNTLPQSELDEETESFHVDAEESKMEGCEPTPVSRPDVDSVSDQLLEDSVRTNELDVKPVLLPFFGEESSEADLERARKIEALPGYEVQSKADINNAVQNWAHQRKQDSESL